MAYAAGKHAYFICDICSFRYKYTTAKSTWNNFRTCQECYEPKHPQLEPPHLSVDAEALWKPTPDVPLPQSQLGVIITTNLSAAGMTFGSDPIGTDFNGYLVTGAIGTVTVVV